MINMLEMSDTHLKTISKIVFVDRLCKTTIAIFNEKMLDKTLVTGFLALNKDDFVTLPNYGVYQVENKHIKIVEDDERYESLKQILYIYVDKSTIDILED